MRYIGVAGVTSPQQVERLLSALPTQKQLGDTMLKIGIRVSRETLSGHEPKVRGTYPAAHVLPELLIPDSRVCYVLHLHAEEKHLMQCVELGFKRTEGHMHGIQINVPWPEQRLVADCRAALPVGHNTIILRIGRDALDMARNEADKVAKRMRPYAGTIDYCLLHHKQSMGGQMNPHRVIPYLSAIAQALPNVELACGGGISAENADDLLRSIVGKFPRVSVDAEIELMTPTMRFDTEHACAYVRAVCALHDALAAS